MSDQWTGRLSEYLDGELEAGERAALEAHLAGCAECRRTLDELGRVVARAQSLGEHEPPDLWPGIAQRIAPDIKVIRPRRHSFSVPQLIAASVLLVICSGLAVLSIGRYANFAAKPPAAVLAPVVASWTNDARYYTAVAQLHAALEEGRTRGLLDSATMRVVERNLTVIDTAIAQARRALASDPGSAYLSHHLAETMRRKLELLRRATAVTTGRT